MSAPTFDSVKKLIKEDFGGVFPIVMMLFLLIAMLVAMPYQRGKYLGNLMKEYSLPQPLVMLQKGQEKERDIVYVSSENNVPAVVYMLESEKILGKQKWLDRAYQTYTLTNGELTQLQKMRQQHTIDQGISDRQKGLIVQDVSPVNLQQRLAQL